DEPADDAPAASYAEVRGGTPPAVPVDEVPVVVGPVEDVLVDGAPGARCAPPEPLELELELDADVAEPPSSDEASFIPRARRPTTRPAPAAIARNVPGRSRAKRLTSSSRSPGSRSSSHEATSSTRPETVCARSLARPGSSDAPAMVWSSPPNARTLS